MTVRRYGGSREPERAHLTATVQKPRLVHDHTPVCTEQLLLGRFQVLQAREDDPDRHGLWIKG